MKKNNITINGKNFTATAGKTILEVINENKIDKIPTLCYDKRIEPYGSCFLCVVEVEGIKKLIPSCSTPVTDGMIIHTDNERIKSSRKAALELLLSNHYADCIGPCTNNCPAGVDAQGYVALISMGKYREALKLVKENNPLPLSIGRVCVRDCEVACHRNLLDEPVAINALKRYIADIDNQNKWIPEIKKSKNKKVAIIGGGPAGLTCAYYLTLEGYPVTIFEKLPKLGGMLRYGIPEYRLPKDILDSEIKWIIDLGIEVKTGVEMGKDFDIETLQKKGYEAVFVGVGAHKSSSMRVKGEDDTTGVIKGIDFLRDTVLKGKPELNGTVAIVGGGNTAIDAARTVLRCGADKVKIVYRRSVNEMPAHHEEIETAKKEGIEMLFLTNPKSIITEKNRLKSIECLKMRLEDPEVPGERPRPVPINGSEFILDCDWLIGAIGQKVDTAFANSDKDIKLEKWGTIIADKNTFETSKSGVYAGGDVVTGPYTAISSIAQGKNAATSIDEFLQNGKNKKKRKGEFLSFKHKFGEIPEREFSCMPKIPREKMPELALSKRKNNFNEVELGFSDSQSLKETHRCMECGCSEYSECQLRKYATDFEADISELTGEVRKYLVDNRHPFITLDPNKCINCGKCVRTCSEILMISAIDFVNRGFKAIVKPAMEKPLLETNCISCGNCIDVCPTGAISEKFPFKILGTLPKENHESVCNFCSIGCKINYKVLSDDIFYVSNNTEEIMDSVNNGYLCVKGRFGHRYLTSEARLETPIIRINGQASEVKTDEAVQYVSKKIKNIIKKFGADSVAVFGSPKMSNEELFLLQKFARAGLKTNNISSFSNMINDLKHDSLDDSLGLTVSTTSMNNLSNADVIVAINSNLSEDNLIMELKIKEAQKKGAKLIVINSSEIKIIKFADLWIDSRKGTNTILLNGILSELIKKELVNKNFIKATTENYSELKNMLQGNNAEDVCGLTGINIEKFKELTRLLEKENSNIVFVYDIDSKKEKSVNDLKAIGNYLLLTNRIYKKFNGLILLRDFSNSAGLLDMGVTPDYLPGYVKSFESEEIKRISKIWNVNLKKIFKPVNLKEKLLDGEIKAILIFGEDPLSDKKLLKYFKGVEFLLVHDLFNTNTAKKADVVLPAASYIEDTGTFTNCDTKIQKTKQIIPVKNKLKNRQLIEQLANNLGCDFNYKSPKEIFNEIKLINRFYSNCQQDDFWNKNLSKNRFYTKNNKAVFSVYDIDLVTFDPKKPDILYSENYYKKNIKCNLI
ncbi:MAG: molybdopterin-dependent oxidoreductase [Bacteroidales bacterium]|nr:molybdopterin-dependent oxidoreductase [Bacteroidales bacterium]